MSYPLSSRSTVSFTYDMLLGSLELKGRSKDCIQIEHKLQTDIKRPRHTYPQITRYMIQQARERKEKKKAKEKHQEKKERERLEKAAHLCAQQTMATITGKERSPKLSRFCTVHITNSDERIVFSAKIQGMQLSRRLSSNSRMDLRMRRGHSLPKDTLCLANNIPSGTGNRFQSV